MLKRKSERRAVDRKEHETLQVVAFVVGTELYGLDIANVQEIERVQPITKVPNALSFVEGVIQLRGAIIPIIDLARRFGLPPTVSDRQSRIIIARMHGQGIGFIVGAVTEVIPIPLSSIGPAPSLTFERSERVISGMARVGEGLISLISLERLFSNDEFQQLSLL